MSNEFYEFPIQRFITPEKFNKLKEFAKGKETPFLIIDLDVIKEKYLELTKDLPTATVYYAVKANPMPEVISLLNDLGSHFDIASRYELDLLLSLGVNPDRISYGNTIKKRTDIEYFHNKGVTLFVTDSIEDLLNISAGAPGAKVFFRLLTECTGSDWPLSKKFGSHPDMTYSLIIKARDLGLIPFGISFHVGSQQRDIGQWDEAIARCRYLFDSAKEIGIHLKMINLGGGFPANYLEPTNPIIDYINEIQRFLSEDFKDAVPILYIEPGRSIAADSGVIVSEVIRVSKKSKNTPNRWVFLDVGTFGGLVETLNEAIKYPIFIDKHGYEEEVILAGPTCDSMDVLYEKYKYTMPSTISAGDPVFIFTTGAYTKTYSSVAFNGFPPLKAYVLE